MQISSRFTMAVHTLLCIDFFGKTEKVTSDFIAGSVGTNPVIIRKLLIQLKAAGLIQVKRGTGGTALEKPLSDISLYDVYHAVDCVGNDSLFHFHEHPCPQCPVGKTIHAGLDDRLHEIQDTMEDKMRSISLADVAGTMQTAFQKEA